jgi:hypothetical protein
MKVTAKINLGRLDPADVLVELYFGSVNQYGDISDGASHLCLQSLQREMVYGHIQVRCYVYSQDVLDTV